MESVILHYASDITQAAAAFLAAGIPLVVCAPGEKRPLTRSPATRPFGDVIALTHPDHATALSGLVQRLGRVNLGVYLGPSRESLLLACDIDGPTGLEKAAELGVRRRGTWVDKTGSGGFHVFYRHPLDRPLRRVTRAGGFSLDLLTNGFALIPPSRTASPYRWLDGHSPNDIPLAMLPEPPNALLDYWEAQAAAPLPAEARSSQGPGAWHLLASPIPEGRRNSTLTQVGGWLRLYHPPAVVEALLHAVNDARRRPPLPEREVTGIVASVSRYAQPGVNGHPRAVVPSFTRRESPDG